MFTHRHYQTTSPFCHYQTTNDPSRDIEQDAGQHHRVGRFFHQATKQISHRLLLIGTILFARIFTAIPAYADSVDLQKAKSQPHSTSGGSGNIDNAGERAGDLVTGNAKPIILAIWLVILGGLLIKKQWSILGITFVFGILVIGAFESPMIFVDTGVSMVKRIIGGV